MSNPFVPNLQNIINPKPLELGTSSFDTMATKPCVLHDTYFMPCVACQVSRVRCQVAHFNCHMSPKNSQTVRKHFLCLQLFETLYLQQNESKHKISN